MQFEVWIPEITLHRDGPHLLNWSVINRHGQRSYEWACVCQLTKGLWLNWPHHHSVKAWGIQGTLWHLRSPSYLRTIWRVKEVISCYWGAAVTKQTNHSWCSPAINPGYKGQGSRDDRSNYAQPLCALYSVQFLGSISTILVQLWRSSDFLCNLKSGYQRSHYTEMALICLIDQLLTDMDKDHMSGLVFVNWQKAFDLTDRTIILSKLEAYRVPYGIYGAPPTWGLFEGLRR